MLDLIAGHASRREVVLPEFGVGQCVEPLPLILEQEDGHLCTVQATEVAQVKDLLQSYDVAMLQDAAWQSEAVLPAAELRHAQDKIAALEDQIADMRAQLEPAQRRGLWLQGQIEQFQQRLLPPPHQSIIERIAEVIARLKRPKASA